jgi:diguanylate cyclase (GGDEF)-like protein
MGIDLRVRLESLIVHPNGASVIFFAGGAVAGLSVLLGSHNLHRPAAILLGDVCFAVIAACILFAIGDRLPLWTLHVVLGVATVLISVAAAIGPNVHANLAMLYIWIALYAALYFRPLPAVFHIGAAGAAYAVVLAVGSNVDKPVVAWFAIFGTAVVSALVVFGLVSVLRRTSREDPLTLLPNRRTWDERADEELERARRNRTPLSLAIIDIDNFKTVNDRDGHQAGDLLLRKLADGWEGIIRGSGDFMARLGGDEFGLLAPNSDDVGIRRIVKRLHEISPSGVSCSIGVATLDGVETAADLFRRADEAMYRAKRERRAA